MTQPTPLEFDLVQTREFTSKKPIRVTADWFEDVSIKSTIPPETAFIDSVYRNDVIESVTVGVYPDGQKIMINGRRRLAATKLADALRWQDELEAASAEERKPLKKNWERVMIPVVVIEDVTDLVVRGLAAELNSNRGDNILSDISSIGYFVHEAEDLGSDDITQSLKHAARCTGIKYARVSKLWGIGALDEHFIQAIGERNITETTAAKIAGLSSPLKKKLLKILKERDKITATDLKEVLTARRDKVQPTSLPTMEIPEEVDPVIELTSVHATIEQIDFDALIEVDSEHWLQDMVEYDETEYVKDSPGSVLVSAVQKLIRAYEMDKKRAGL